MMRTSLLAVLGSAALVACATPSDEAIQADALTFSEALGVAPDAMLPPPVGMTLTMPSVLVKGVPNTVSISNGPTRNGRVALFAGGNPANPAFCPPQLGGDCFDISNPATFIKFDRTDAAGAVSFTITPPNRPSLTSGVLQAGGIETGGQTYLSNTQAVTFISACDGPSSTFPADGDGGIAPGDDLTVSFAVPIAQYQTYEVLRGGAPVATTVSFSGDNLTATIDPSGSLLANTLYTLRISSPCAQTTSLQFTTGNADAIGGYNLVGENWLLDLSGVVITTPAALGIFAGSILGPYDDRFVIQTTAWDGGTETIDLMLAEVDSVAQVQLCAETTEFAGVPLDNDPAFSATLPDLGGIAENASLSGNINPGGTGISNVNLSAYVSAAEVATITGIAPGFICLITGCTTCPVSGTSNGCIFIAGTGVVANSYAGDVAPISAADELAGCP